MAADRPRCPKCSAYLRVNRDGTIRIHKTPPPPWGRPKSDLDYCEASGTTPRHWGLKVDGTPIGERS